MVNRSGICKKQWKKDKDTPLCFGEMKRKYRGRQRLPSTVPIQVEKNQVIKIFGVFGLKNIKSIMCYWYWLYIYIVLLHPVYQVSLISLAYFEFIFIDLVYI